MLLPACSADRYKPQTIGSLAYGQEERSLQIASGRDDGPRCEVVRIVASITPSAMSEHSTSQPRYADDLWHLGALTMRSTRDGDAHVIELAGEFDLAGAALLEEELLRVEASDAEQIVIDLRELEFIDSTGVRLVYMADARTRRGDARLTIRRGPSRVHRIFELTDLADRLPFVD